MRRSCDTHLAEAFFLIYKISKYMHLIGRLVNGVHKIYATNETQSASSESDLEQSRFLSLSLLCNLVRNYFTLKFHSEFTYLYLYYISVPILISVSILISVPILIYVPILISVPILHICTYTDICTYTTYLYLY